MWLICRLWLSNSETNNGRNSCILVNNKVCHHLWKISSASHFKPMDDVHGIEISKAAPPLFPGTQFHPWMTDLGVDSQKSGLQPTIVGIYI